MSDTIPAGEECFTFGQLLWYFTKARRKGYTVHGHIQRQYDEVRRFFEAIQIWEGVDLGDEWDEPGRSLKTMKQLRADLAKRSQRPFSAVEALPLTAFLNNPDLSEKPDPSPKEGQTPATNAAGQAVDKARTSAGPPAKGMDTGELNELLGVAESLRLKGNELLVIQRIVNGRGSVSIADLKTVCEWNNPDDNWNSTRKRLNKKLGPKCWELYRHANEAKAKKLAQPKRPTVKKPTVRYSGKAGGRK